MRAERHRLIVRFFAALGITQMKRWAFDVGRFPLLRKPNVLAGVHLEIER